MGIFPRFETRNYAPSSDYWYNPVYMPTSAGVPVTEKDALKYLTVFACVTLIAGDVAKLPLNLYKRRKTGQGKDLVTNHNLYDLLHNAPNPETTSFNWREASQGHLLLWGNHYDLIVRDKTGAIIELWPFPDPSQVKVYRKNNRILYEYENAEGKNVVKGRDEIFHIPGYGFNGLYGMSMIGVAREAIGLGVATETFGSKYFSEGTHPSGMLSIEHDLGDDDKRKAYFKALKEQYAGLGKSHSIMVLQNAETYTNLTVPPEDSQFLETRDHQKIEICGMYHVPPHKIAIHGQNSNYNNLEQENASYVDSCLMHWLVRWEAQISLQLLTPKERRKGLFFEFAIQGLLRGDSAARSEYYNKLLQIGSMTPNEIRDKENMNPVEGGDQSLVMMNLTTLEKVGEDIVLPGDAVPEKEPEIEEVEEDEDKKELKDFFKNNKEKETRSIRMRDRISKRFRPLIFDAAQTVVNREAKAIKKRLTGRQNREEADSMGNFLNDFYKKFPEYISQKMGPVLRSYLQSTIDESVTEIGVDEYNLDKEIKEYIDNYATRHASSSLGQMTALLEGDLEALDKRADEWLERRPDKIANDEEVRASNAAFSWVVFAAGFTLVWRIRGKKTCPYCTSLNGARVARGGSFVEPGGKIDPKDGSGAMTVYGLKRHPPLHQGCDCYVSV